MIKQMFVQDKDSQLFDFLVLYFIIPISMKILPSDFILKVYVKSFYFKLFLFFKIIQYVLLLKIWPINLNSDL